MHVFEGERIILLPVVNAVSNFFLISNNVLAFRHLIFYSNNHGRVLHNDFYVELIVTYKISSGKKLKSAESC